MAQFLSSRYKILLMEKQESVNELLNDLLKINNDRIAGYEKAISETKNLDIDLKSVFEGMIRQSQECKEELSAEIAKNGGIVEDDTTAAGKIYRAWMDIKSAMTDTDRLSILGSCEFGEDAAQRAYEFALNSDKLVGSDLRKLVEDEKNSLKKSHDLIKAQHEVHKQLQ
jgi:uncharacterized protein (TIGR02284 family)